MACRFVLLQLIIFLQFCEIQGQCQYDRDGQRGCLNHCINRITAPCTCESNGEWTGSPYTFCQKRNIVERATVVRGSKRAGYTADKTVDGDLNSYLYSRGDQPRLVIDFKQGEWRIKEFTITLDISLGDSFRFSIRRGKSMEVCHEQDVVFPYTKNIWTVECEKELLGDGLIIDNMDFRSLLYVYEVTVQSCAQGTYGPHCEHICSTQCHQLCSVKSGQCIFCNEGEFGDRCQDRCPIGCKNNICSSIKGQCLNGCRRGYTGDQCLPCEDGNYGIDCKGTCSEGCNDVPCDYVTGQCSTCKYGYSGDNCTACARGRYGYKCNNECSYCLGLNCDNFGICRECKLGFYGKTCTGKCPLNCGGNRSCDIKSRECLFGCKTGYTGDLCLPCARGTYGDSCKHNCSVGCRDVPCDHTTGYCSSCLNGYSGVQCLPCTSGRFGFNCSNKCNYCLRSKCDNNGICRECKSDRYGPYCNKSCPINCNGSCDISSGQCLSCKRSFYSQYCNVSCNVHCGNPGTCSSDGKCINGCIDGWVGDKCDQECDFANCEKCTETHSGYARCIKCKDGWFLHNSDCRKCGGYCKICSSYSSCSVCVNGRTGFTCSEECSVNCQNRSCNIRGKCDTCVQGYYGLTCGNRCSDKCVGGYQECSGSDGSCLRGCKNGTFGVDCERPCPEHCLFCFSNHNCSKCEDGYHGRYCSTQCLPNCLSCENAFSCSKCSDGYYGTRCQIKCPDKCMSCENGTLCIQCNNGWTGDICQCNTNCSDSCGENGQCKSGCMDGLYGTRCDILCPNQDCESCNQTSGNCSVCVSGRYGQKCDKACSENCFGKNCAISGKCLQGCADEFTGDTCSLRKMEAGSFPLLPVVLGVLGVIIILIILVVILMSRRKLNKVEKMGKESRAAAVVMSNLRPESRMVYENMDVSNKASDSTQADVIQSNNPNKQEKSIYASRGSYALLIELDPESTDIQGNEGTNDVVQQTEYYNVQVNKIAVSALSDVIQKKKDNDEFQTEFESLPQGLTETYTKAIEKKNRKRNRYKKIYPYDFNRVKLIGDNTDGGDYINASYVHGFSNKNAFIAAQGPFTDDTLVDFWRMIWQKKVTKIAMLTNLVEGQVTKCWKYWPDDKERYGSCEVSLKKTTTYTNCVVRTLNVKRKSESKQMQVNHFHFTAWPDKDVPKSASTILDFRNKVVRNESSKDGPTLVHCSAGIGRTGTYIALDYLVREGEQEGSVDILNCLTTLRRQRTQFVQTVEQYEFLHEALLEGLTMKDSSVDAKDFPAMYDKIKRKNPKSGKTFLREQFDDINKMIPNEKEGNFATAKLPQNRTKNRYSNILAADNCRYFVTSSNGSNYINAIAIPSHKKTAAFALTQMPLPDTIEDFWNLVLSQSMTTIVMMNVVKKEKDPDIYWPLSGLSTFGKIKVQQLEEDVTNEAYRILKLSVTRVRSNECLVVKQFQCLFWPDEDGVPRGTRQMLQLMEDVDSWQRSNDNPTIVVHCLDGARKSGLFCAVSAILERVRAEQTVNVVRTISQMRSKRQQIVSSQEQLEYCYDVVNEYLEMSNTYTNV